MKKIFLSLTLLCATLSLMAASIGEQQARRIANNFFAQGVTRSAASVELVWAGSQMDATTLSRAATDQALLYIYNRTGAPGFVIVAGEDQAAPIVGYSYERAFDPQQMAPGLKALLEAWCKQLADVQAGKFIVQNRPATAGTPVKEYQTALWNQGAPFNWEAPVFDNYSCATGCVATALSIICYYHGWPNQGVGTTPEYSYKDVYGVQRTIPANVLGRTYEYDQMRSDYNSDYTEEEGRAVAALMYDVGAAMQMSYHYTGSGAFSELVPDVMSTYFGYSKETLFLTAAMYSESEWAEALKQNLDQYGPTYFSGADDQGYGHAFVLDGYDSAGYFRINYGWGGVDNGYYLLPSSTYHIGQDACFAMRPDRTGTSTYPDHLVLITAGDAAGNSYFGLESSVLKFAQQEPFNFRMIGVYNMGKLNFTGQVKLSLCDATGQEKEALYTANITNIASGGVIGIQNNATITKSIVEGDRLRCFYKGSASSEWKRMRGYWEDVYDEIIVQASPEEVAELLNLQYEKSSKTFSFKTPFPMQYSIKRVATGEVVATGNQPCHTYQLIDVSGFAAGEYLFSIAGGGKAYCLTVVF